MPRMKDDEVRFRAALADAQKKGGAIDVAAIATAADVTTARAANLFKRTQPQKPRRKWIGAPGKRGQFLTRAEMRDAETKAAAKPAEPPKQSEPDAKPDGAAIQPTK